MYGPLLGAVLCLSRFGVARRVTPESWDLDAAFDEAWPAAAFNASADVRRLSARSPPLRQGGHHDSGFMPVRKDVHDAHLINPAAHRVSRLPGLPADWTGEHYAGMIDSDDAHGGRLFYWFFEKSASGFPSAAPTPLLIWLNGGPGCTSMDGLFLENGPFALKPGSTTQLDTRAASWHKAAHVLYIDQPVGTGFSHTGSNAYCRDDACITAQFKTFLTRFALSYPALIMRDSTHTVPIFFSGESHAGHYVPLMVQGLVARPDRIPLATASAPDFDVQGFALGNAWIDPFHQYDVSRFAQALGLIDAVQGRKIKAAEKACQAQLAKLQLMGRQCWDLLDEVVRVTAKDHGGLKVNMYDTRESARSTVAYPPGHDRLETFMNLPGVRTALHVDAQAPRFRECANPPYDALRHQDGLGVMPSLKYLLDRKKIRALFYNGEHDLICNHVGLERALHNLDWGGARDFHRAVHAPWARGGALAGYSKRFGLLTLLMVKDAGHMVPMNQPEAALEMIRKFIAGENFEDEGVCEKKCLDSLSASARLHPSGDALVVDRRARRGGHGSRRP
ncbi:Alpha/Beta hydrolase protein [Pelagophyceae sp. CCMP2097]|nr:Alpha/Beta hydrolase protein [Pelagophyceae sp. CCMP2097]